MTEPAVDTRRGTGQVTGAGKTFIILIADLRKETDTQGQVWGWGWGWAGPHSILALEA